MNETPLDQQTNAMAQMLQAWAGAQSGPTPQPNLDQRCYQTFINDLIDKDQLVNIKIPLPSSLSNLPSPTGPNILALIFLRRSISGRQTQAARSPFPPSLISPISYLSWVKWKAAGRSCWMG